MLPKIKHAIGDGAWIARWESTEKRVTCAECGGTKSLRVILFDGAEHTIDCEGCKRGYLGPLGYNTVYDRVGMALATTVLGVEIDGGKLTYRTALSYRVEESDIFSTEAEAIARAQQIAADMDAAELEQLKTKEKPASSWSWHVHYHRSEIRRLEKDLARHKSKLDVARAKSKEPKPQP